MLAIAAALPTGKSAEFRARKPKLMKKLFNTKDYTSPEITLIWGYKRLAALDSGSVLIPDRIAPRIVIT